MDVCDEDAVQAIDPARTKGVDQAWDRAGRARIDEQSLIPKAEKPRRDEIVPTSAGLFQRKDR